MEHAHTSCALVAAVVLLSALMAFAPVDTTSSHATAPSPTVAFASAGGGGASGGGGGGGDGSSSSSGSTDSYGDESSGNPIVDFLSMLAFPFIFVGGVVIFTVRLYARR